MGDEGRELTGVQEMGAADAIEKGYLHQLSASSVSSAGERELIEWTVLAIYLDPEDPTNIVECYTFTITYETDSDGSKVRSALLHRDQR